MRVRGDPLAPDSIPQCLDTFSKNDLRKTDPMKAKAAGSLRRERKNNTIGRPDAT